MLIFNKNQFNFKQIYCMINNSIIQFPIKNNILSQNLKFKFSLFSITIFGKFLELKYYVTCISS